MEGVIFIPRPLGCTILVRIHPDELKNCLVYHWGAKLTPPPLPSCNVVIHVEIPTIFHNSNIAVGEGGII